MKKTITFLLPTRGGRGPSGGYKIVYEYANRLVETGYTVYIVYPLVLNFKKQSFWMKLRAIPRFFWWKYNGISGRKWFNLSHKIKEILVPTLNQRFIPESDIYVATAVQTAYYLGEYKLKSSKKIYLIQDYEVWGMSNDYVENSYRLGLYNIAISQWLKNKVESTGAKCDIIKNAFDFNYFRLTQNPKDRSPLTVSMLYHLNERKGCKYGIEALSIVKKKYPALKATLFGVPPRPSDLPKWINYIQQPNRYFHNKIYNENAIYIGTSIQEGWGLTIGEAMICGAAIVCTDTLGFREMVNNNMTGIIVPIKDSKALAEGIISLITDNNKRIRLANAGTKTIKAFTWDNSINKFINIIER